MKHLFFLMTLFLSTVFVSEAQIVYLYATGTTKTDSMRNSETSYLTTGTSALNTIGLGGCYDVQYTITNDSATTSAWVILQSSIDGITYHNHFGVAGTNGINCDSIATGSLTSGSVFQWTFHAEKGALKEASIRNGSVLDSVVVRYNIPTAAGRRLSFRLKQVHAAGGKSRSTSELLTCN